jgi:hypothetical protein
MSSVFVLGAAAVGLLVGIAQAAAQPRGSVAHCLQLAALVERHVAKNAAHPLPSMSVDISVAIETCRQGRVDGAVDKLEALLRGKGFRP